MRKTGPVAGSDDMAISCQSRVRMRSRGTEVDGSLGQLVGDGLDELVELSMHGRASLAFEVAGRTGPLPTSAATDRRRAVFFSGLGGRRGAHAIDGLRRGSGCVTAAGAGSESRDRGAQPGEPGRWASWRSGARGRGVVAGRGGGGRGGGGGQ